MREFKNQIKVSSSFSELLDFSELNCTASCCGLQAFEIHKSLLLRQVIDKNLAGISGVDWYNGVKEEIDLLHKLVSELDIGHETEIPVIYPRNDSSPEFYIPRNELQHLLLRWQRVFRQVKGTQAIP